MRAPVSRSRPPSPVRLAALMLAGPAHAAFPGGDGAILTLHPNGFTTPIHDADGRLTPNVGRWSDPHASADGMRVYAVYSPPPQGAVSAAGVWSMRPDGTDRVQITNSASDRHPAPFPRGGRLVVSTGGDLWSIGFAPLGTPTPRTPLFRVPGLRAQHPEVSPSGAKVAFDVTDPTGQTDIWELDVATKATRQVTRTKTNEEDPSWSPDGTRIAFASNPGRANWDIYATAPRASLSIGGPILPPAVEQVTQGPAQDRQPAWAPSGRSIAFAADGHHVARVLLASRERILTNAFGVSPDWAPAAHVTDPVELPCTIAVKPHGDSVVEMR
jgi:Tol biopolymer transport system component